MLLLCFLNLLSSVVDQLYFCCFVVFSLNLVYAQPTLNNTTTRPPTAVKCSQPEDPQNGRAFYDNYTYGSMVKYQCKTNFKLHGPQNRTCQANREWSGKEPECKS